MARMDLRLRLLGALTRPLSVARMSDEQVLRLQKRRVRHNRVTDLLVGSVAEGVTLEDRTIPGPAGELRVRTYVAEDAGPGPHPLVVNFHGGGWTFGTLETADWLCSRVSSALGAVVVSVDYRLAPVQRFPAAVDDCYAGLLWAAEHAPELGADPARLGVMGESAGGNLSAVVCLLARDRSGPPIAHQALLYPSTDLTLASPSIGRNANAPVLSRGDVLAFRLHYLGQHDPRDPLASPLLAEEHSGLPPALVQVAEHDPIRDDGDRYAEALRAAGVPVRFTEYAGMPHGYLNFPAFCRSAPDALAELCAEQNAALGAAPLP